MLFLISFLVYILLSPSPAIATTVTIPIASGADDSKITNGLFSSTDTTAPLGTNSNNPTSFFFRFTNLSIPPEATITLAYITFIGTGSNSGDVSLNISAQNTVTPLAPTDLSEFNSYSSNLSDTILSWSNIPSPSWGVGVSTPDLSSIITEIISLPNWQSGNAIQFFLTNNGSSAWAMRQVIMGNWTGGEAKPTLTVSYSFAENPPNTPTNLSQFNSDGTTPISAGGSTSETTVVLKFNLSSTNDSDSITPQVEVQSVGSTFTGTPNYSADPIDFSGDPVTAVVTISNLTRGQSYYWQARASNSAGFSQFIDTDSDVDFIISTIAPVTTDTTDGLWYSTPIEVQLICTDQGGPGCQTTYYTTDGSTPDTNSSSGNTINFYVDGIYTLKYFSVDTNDVAEAIKTASHTVNIDSTPPYDGFISYNNGFYVNTAVNLTLSDGVDITSGINSTSRVIQRRSATATNQICGNYGSWTTISPSGTYPNYIDTDVEIFNCYQYRFAVSDRVGNEVIYTSANTAQIEQASNLLIQDTSSTVSSGSNDSRLVDGVFTNTNTTDQLGKNNNNSASHFILFNNIQIAQGTNITSSNIYLTMTGSGAGQVNLRLSAVNLANPSAPANASQFNTYLSQLTSQTIGWTSVPTNLSYGTTLSSPDLTPIVQAIVNRSDWTIGNSILINIANDSSSDWANATFVTGDYQGSEPKPTLDISYIYSNSDPDPQDDYYTTSGEIVLGVMENDSDPDADSISISSVDSPGHGTATISDNTIVYTPDTNYSGTDTFTYTIIDSFGHSSMATVTITVLANPTYYTYTFTVDRSSVPVLYFNDITYLIHLGTVASVSATIDGQTIEGVYDSTLGDFYFTDTSQGSDIILTIKNPSDTTVFSVSIAPLKDNMSFAWSHGMDDNVYLQNQVNIFEAKNWRGMLYLISSQISDSRDESWIFDKPALIRLVDNGWSIGNHTWDHLCFGDNMSDSEFLQNSILNGYSRLAGIIEESNRSTYSVIGFAAPCFASQYDSLVSSMRQDGSTAIKFNESQANALMQVDLDADGFANNGKTATPIDSTTLKIGRDLGVETDPDYSIDYLDWMFTNSSTDRHFWYNTLSHGNKETNLSTVVDYAYSTYGLGGSNQLWVAPSDEIYSYLLVRDNTQVSTPTLVQVADGSSANITNTQIEVGSTSALISWNTSRSTSNQLLYGLVSSSLSSQTSQTDAQTQHSQSLDNLVSCTKYYYQTKSTGEYEAVSYGNVSSFITSGCLNSSAVLSSSEKLINTSGGSLDLSTNDGNMAIIIPDAFSDSSAVFQAKQLNKDTVLQHTSLPPNYSSVSSFFVDLIALSDVGTTQTNFSLPISLTLSYDPDLVSQQDTSTLTIFSYHQDSWQPLSDCLHDSDNHTVTCNTGHFSIFSLFVATTSTSIPTSNYQSTTNYSFSTSSSASCTSPKPLFIPDLFEIRATKTSAKIFFTPLADTSDFYISFSEKANAQEHGEQVTLIRQGVQSHTIYHLKPNTTYYIKVRGQIACAVGDWSNIMTFTTNSQTYYRYFSPKNNFKSTKITSSPIISPSVTPIPSFSPKPTESPKPSETKPQISQKCFLWWCW